MGDFFWNTGFPDTSVPLEMWKIMWPLKSIKTTCIYTPAPPQSSRQSFIFMFSFLETEENISLEDKTLVPWSQLPPKKHNGSNRVDGTDRCAVVSAVMDFWRVFPSWGNEEEGMWRTNHDPVGNVCLFPKKIVGSGFLLNWSQRNIFIPYINLE